MAKHLDTTRPVDGATWGHAPHDPEVVPAHRDVWSDDPDRSTRRGDTTPYPYSPHNID